MPPNPLNSNSKTSKSKRKMTRRCVEGLHTTIHAAIHTYIVWRLVRVCMCMYVCVNDGLCVCLCSLCLPSNIKIRSESPCKLLWRLVRNQQQHTILFQQHGPYTTADRAAGH